MKTALYYSNNDVRVEDRPKPQINEGEVLVKVMASGICGTDVMEWYRIHRAPLVLGHEITGIIEETGKGVEKYKAGDRVAVAHHVPCNVCDYCLKGYHTVCETLRTTNFDPGGFAQFVRIPAINVDRGIFPLPDNIDFEEGTFVEPLACVVRGQRVAGLKPGDTVLVLGSGISGLLHIGLARALGAGTIIATDINEFRLRSALEIGADHTVSAREDVAAKVREHNQGKLADLVIICASPESVIRQALDSVDRSGTVLFFAAMAQQATFDRSINEIFWRNEIKLVSTYAGSPADHETALKLMAAGRLDLKSMITHRLPFDKIGEGFKMVAEGGESIKIIVNPQE